MSHGHADHYGALPVLARAGKGKLKPEDTFCQRIIPAQCTGLNTIFAVHRELPAKLVVPSTGTRVLFGA